MGAIWLAIQIFNGLHNLFLFSLQEPSKSFSDESRLSKYIRRVSRDSDRERRLSSAKQLKEYLKTQEGVKVYFCYMCNMRQVLPVVPAKQNSLWLQHIQLLKSYNVKAHDYNTYNYDNRCYLTWDEVQ